MDHPDQLTLEHAISDGLRSRGTYRAEMDLPSAQRLVDIQWAAHRAARRLGIRAKIDIHDARLEGRPAKTLLVVTTRSAAPRGGSR